MRPRGYDPSRSSRFYDPRNGRYVGTLDDFLRVADEIAKQRDRAEKYFDRARERIAEGVPQARASYWRRRLSSTRADLAEQDAFWREIDEQLTRETSGEKKRREKREAEDRERRVDDFKRKRREEPKAIEYELSLDYDAKKGAARGSEVDITIRFWRTDQEPITMREAWDAVNTYRATGEFPANFDVAGIDWHGIAAKRQGRPKTSMLGPSAQVDTALSDFFAIIHSVRRDDLDLERIPVRLGSVKQDG